MSDLISKKRYHLFFGNISMSEWRKRNEMLEVSLVSVFETCNSRKISDFANICCQGINLFTLFGKIFGKNDSKTNSFDVLNTLHHNNS